LGQTSANPVLTTLKHFRPVYESRVKEPGGALQSAFDLSSAVGDAEAIIGRKSIHAGA
jgi:hypothetical protein